MSPFPNYWVGYTDDLHKVVSENQIFWKQEEIFRGLSFLEL